MFVLLAAAYAYETDQLTARAAPLLDITEAANREVDRLLTAAAERTNELTRCRGPAVATQRVLATQIYRLTSHAEYVRDRGELGGFGFGAYAAWLETAAVDRRSFNDRGDIYGDLKPGESFVLGTVGVCSTVRIANVLMGTDKPDHFWSQGYEYLVASHRGKNDARAIKWGTDSERGQYGLLTSDVFSFADLYANWQGYQFYRELLQKGSSLELGTDGCVHRTANWSWADWLDDGADEVINPPVYGPHVRESVQARLWRERDEICAGYADWGPAAALRRSQVEAREIAHVGAKAPVRRDEWGLDALCSP
jgi:hypothetical protein